MAGEILKAVDDKIGELIKDVEFLKDEVAWLKRRCCPCTCHLPNSKGKFMKMQDNGVVFSPVAIPCCHCI